MRLVLLFVFLLSCSFVHAFDRIKVDPDLEIMELLRNTYVFTDKTGEMSAEQILSLDEEAWKKDLLNGYSENAEWILIPFTNLNDQEFEKVLYLNNPITHKVDFYFVVNGVLQDEFIATGLARSSEAKLYNDPKYPVNLHFPPNSKVDVLVRVFDPMSSIGVPFFLMSFDKALALKDRDLSLSLLWLGILVLSLVLSSFLYVSIRQEMFLYYILVGLSAGMIVTANAGIVFLFFDSDPYQIVTNYYQIGAVLMINAMPRFLNCVVPIADISTKAWKGIKIMGYVAIGISVLYCIPFFKFSFFFTSLFINTMVSFSGVLFLYLLIILFVASWQRMERAILLFLVYLIYLGLAFSNVILPLFGIADKGLNGLNYVLAGSIFETIAFMFFMAQVTLSVYEEREKLYKQVQNTQETMMNAIVKGQEDERNRFAKDLHDGFGQMISSLMLNLKGLESLKSSNTERRVDIFKQASSILSDMYIELKNICFNLMPQTLIVAGVGEALREFAQRINQSGRLFLQVSFYDMDDRFTEVQEISLYRISQEWVNNIIKYSDATKIDLQITRDEEEITLLIEDNGSGFDKELLENGKGNGWKNINSRANLIKGEVVLDTTVGLKGATFILNTPVKLQVGDKVVDTIN